MIARIRGQLLEKKAPYYLFVEVGGITYEIMAPLPTFYALQVEKTEIILHTHWIVREDSQSLYGFHRIF